MAILVLDRKISDELIAERKARGIDQHDEVWDGVYVMSPLADDEHQNLVGEFDSILRAEVQRPGLGKVRPGVNVSDREPEWTSNFRVPDVAVFLNDTRAINRGAFWLGGPDFAIEIASENDRTRDKLPFYANVGVRELLIVDRDPWALELYRLRDGELKSVGRSTPKQPVLLASEVLPITCRLQAAKPRPHIQVSLPDGTKSWMI
jgi:Uma2 family endonuclease